VYEQMGKRMIAQHLEEQCNIPAVADPGFSDWGQNQQNI